MLVSDGLSTTLEQSPFTYEQDYGCFHDIETFGCCVVEAAGPLILRYIASVILDLFCAALVTYSVCFFEYSVVTLTNISHFARNNIEVFRIRICC